MPRLQIDDPELSALKSAVRAAIVMPAVFAVALELIKQPQTALFASFGSFAMLVLVDFSGPARSRLTAYVCLAATGAVFVVIGTLCSQNAWLAAAAMAVVGFAVLFSSVINGYFAAGVTAAMLAFVLPVSIPATAATIGWRLAGWGLAASVGTCAVMGIWPPRQSRTLRGGAARACLVLADLAESAHSPDPQVIQTRTAAADKVVGDLRRRFQTTPHRPTGPTEQAAALAALIDELGWLLLSLRAVAAAPRAGLCRPENGEALAAAAAVLRSCEALLAGRAPRPGMIRRHQVRPDPARPDTNLPDTARLELAQEAAAQALAQQLSELPLAADDDALESLFGHSFRTRVICGTARQIAGYALAASGAALESPDRPPVSWPHAADGADGQTRHSGEPWPAAASGVAPRPGVPRAIRAFMTEHVTARSVMFRNAVRGSIGLAVAVFIAHRAGLQHSFWVVLGALSVLRSNALGTGKSVLGALAGTAAGIVVGAAILLAVGASDPVLWGVLPVGVLVAAYAPRVISFAVGQAAFTVVLLVLFNIIEPTGWQVGLIRIEDVAIGFAVSLGVGLVFWPRGAAIVLRTNMAAAYSRGADYVAITVGQLTAGRDPAGSAHSADVARAAATAALHQLDDSFRQYLAERSAARTDPGREAALIAGAGRLLRTGRSMAVLGAMLADQGASATLPGYGASLDQSVQAVRSWYVTLGDSLLHGTSVPPPQRADPQDRRLLLRSVRDAVTSSQESVRRGGLLVLWASQHLEMLRRLESHLGAQAIEAAGAAVSKEAESGRRNGRRHNG